MSALARFLGLPASSRLDQRASRTVKELSWRKIIQHMQDNSLHELDENVSLAYCTVLYNMWAAKTSKIHFGRRTLAPSEVNWVVLVSPPPVWIDATHHRCMQSLLLLGLLDACQGVSICSSIPIFTLDWIKRPFVMIRTGEYTDNRYVYLIY